MRPTLLCDVDGCVADLMGGFQHYIQETFGEYLHYQDITRFHLETSPELQDLQNRIGPLGDLLEVFMEDEHVYQNYVDPINGSIEAIERISEVADVVFVTATMKAAPLSFVSKARWCAHRFGDIPMCSIPSGLKHRFTGAWCVDDRWDTCTRWASMGVLPFCFKQPWSEAPEQAALFNWESITQSIIVMTSHLKRSFSGEF